VDLTRSTSDVEAEPALLPPGDTPYDGRLAMKLAEFTAMPTSWAGEGLFAAGNGTPVRESFTGRPSFTYVNSGFAADAGTTTAPPSPRLPSRSMDPQFRRPKSIRSLGTATAHLRDVLGEATYESLARKGESMTPAAMAMYAYDQIDQARTELEHPS
jgi:hypothetical protein